MDVNHRPLFTKVKAKLLDAEAPIWIRPVDRDKGKYEVSTLRTKKGKTFEFKFDVFKDLALLQEDATSGLPLDSEDQESESQAWQTKEEDSRRARAKLEQLERPLRERLTLSKTLKIKNSPSEVKVEVRKKRTFVRKDSRKITTTVPEQHSRQPGSEAQTRDGNALWQDGPKPQSAIQLAFSRLALTEDGLKVLEELKRHRNG